MRNDLGTREALLAVNESDKTVLTGLSVTMNIVKVLPLHIVPTDLITANVIKVKVTDAKENDDVKYTLVELTKDDDGNDVDSGRDSLI